MLQFESKLLWKELPANTNKTRKQQQKNRKAKRRTIKEITTKKSSESLKLNSNQNLKSTQQPKKEKSNKR